MTLLQRIAEGDTNAVTECIDRYGGLVWSLARRLCMNRAEAEDAVQEVFISVWRSAGRYDPKLGTEATFVAMIARRRLIDRVRRRQRRPDGASIAPEVTEAIVVDGTRPEDGNDRVEIGEAADEALEVLGQLSADQQRVLRLSIMHGLSHEKIAESTDMPLGTVKTHIRRGLIKARKIMADRRASARGNGTDRGAELGVS